MTDPPPGYLGADARIGSGPAPELVEAGYALELADAPLLHRGLGLADLAHVLALSDAGAIPAADARALLGELPALLDGEAPADPRYGDLVNARERLLEQRIGTAAGWLNAGRTRREAGRVAFRIALRERLLDLAASTLRFAEGLVALAARERDTLAPDYTYLQVARPTTAGHWALSFAYPALRDLERLRRDHEWVNRSPAGADGARFGIDRGALAAALGFSAPIAHARDALWQADGLAEIASHAALAAVGASRFAEDLELYGSDEFGLLRIGDALCRASAQMPQKRNPYALVVLRGGAGTLIGRATGVLATQRTPSGRTDNLLYAYGEVAGAVDMAGRLLRLAAACAESVTVDAARAEALVGGSHATATDLAEAIVRAAAIDYRSAYRVVGRAIAAGGVLDAAALDAAATDVLGRPLDLDHALVADALDPAASIAARAAREPMDAMLDECRAQAAHARAWIEAERRAAEAAERALVERARSGAGGGGAA